jgi:hypothetical protein
MRFVSEGKLLSPPGPFAAYSERQYYDKPGEPNRQEIQLRFGTIHLLRGHTPEQGSYKSPIGSFLCVRGLDTMQVFVQPQFKAPYWFSSDSLYWLYDSIPFRPGRYKLEHAPLNFPYALPGYSRHQLDSVGIPSISFAAYYRQHEADLACYNPFADRRLQLAESDKYYRLPDNYVPHQPNDLFYLLLAQSPYLKIRNWHLRPLRRYERVLE